MRHIGDSGTPFEADRAHKALYGSFLRLGRAKAAVESFLSAREEPPLVPGDGADAASRRLSMAGQAYLKSVGAAAGIPVLPPAADAAAEFSAFGFSAVAADNAYGKAEALRDGISAAVSAIASMGGDARPDAIRYMADGDRGFSTLSSVLVALASIALDHAAPIGARLFVFGSVARGEDAEGSDVDIAYEMPPIAESSSVRAELSLSREIRATLRDMGLDSDVVDIDDIVPEFRPSFDAERVEVKC